MRPQPPERTARGFTLLETLIALLVLALAMFLGYGFIMRQPQVTQRLDAGEEALRALESSLETLRAGAIPLESGMLLPVIAYPPVATADDLLVDLQVDPTETPGLYVVSLEARYRVGRAIHRKQVRSMVWSP